MEALSLEQKLAAALADADALRCEINALRDSSNACAVVIVPKRVIRLRRKTGGRGTGELSASWVRDRRLALTRAMGELSSEQFISICTFLQNKIGAMDGEAVLAEDRSHFGPGEWDIAISKLTSHMYGCDDEQVAVLCKAVIDLKSKKRGADTADKGATNLRRWTNDVRSQLAQRFNPAQIIAISAALLKEGSEDTEGMKGVLASFSDAALIAVVPTRFVENTAKAGALAFSRAMQKHWSVTLALGTKFIGPLSRIKYRLLRQKLSMEFSADGEGTWTRKEYKGVPFPSLVSHYMLDEMMKKLKKAGGLQRNKDGTCVTVNLRQLLSAHVKHSIDTGFFQVDSDNHVRQAFGQHPEVMGVLDACTQHKGMKVTSAGVIMPHGTLHPQAPGNTQEYMFMEGGDTNEDMMGEGKAGVDMINDLIMDPYLDTGLFLNDKPVLCKCKVVTGGDQAMVDAMNCISGCNGPHPCAYCEVAVTSMTDTNGVPALLRTRERILCLAHATLGGTCPACDKTIVMVVTDKKKQVPFAERGAQAPSSANGKTHLSRHMGVVLGQTPPFLFEPSEWVICILHFCLCIVGGLFQRTICDLLDKMKEPNLDKGHASQLERLQEILKGCGLQVKDSKLTKKSKNVKGHDLHTKSHTFAGRGAELAMVVCDPMVRIVLPDYFCGPWIELEELLSPDFDLSVAAASEACRNHPTANIDAWLQRKRVRIAWARWAQMWKLLNTGTLCK
jgi:hypothetical protein